MKRRYYKIDEDDGSSSDADDGSSTFSNVISEFFHFPFIADLITFKLLRKVLKDTVETHQLKTISFNALVLN